MKSPGTYQAHTVNLHTWLVILISLLMMVFGASASQELGVSPEQPTSQDNVTILVTGSWPSGGGPSITYWGRDGQNVRIEAIGVLPGIPQPILPYQLEVDIGRLPPGEYQADYYIEIYAAPSPGPTPGIPVSPETPDASISFEVIAASESIPVLSFTAKVLLGLLLLLAPLVVPGVKHRTRSEHS